MAPKLDTPRDGQTDLPGPPESADESQRRQLADRLVKASDSATARGQLRQRAEKLPCWHPSSPWNEDGSRRDPEKSLSAYEQPETSLSDADYATHVKEVVERLDQALAAGLATNKLYAIDSDAEAWQEDRRAVHDEIIQRAYERAVDVPCEMKAIIIGGLAGAGKTTILEKHAGVDLSQYLIINPDNFKEELAQRGLIPEVEGLSPMEASTLAHEESSHLARQLAFRALAEGKNVIWDITMSSTTSAERRIQDLRSAGYDRVEGLFVDIPAETSIARTQARHRHGEDLFMGGIGPGGRFIVVEVTLSQFDSEFGTANRRAFESLKDQFDYWALYDNSVDSRPPILVDLGGIKQ